jgi:hypothetical protein
MENSNAIHALMHKRAELAGELKTAESVVAARTADLAHVDATLRMFDPSAKPASIRPRVKRPHPTRFRPGEFTRAVMAVVRQAEKPLTAREIGDRVGVACGLDMSTTKDAGQVVASVRAVLASPREGLACEKNGKEPMVWRVA